MVPDGNTDGLEEDNLVAALHAAVEAGIPGISCAIASKSGVIWQKCAGYADLKALIPVDKDHVFGIGSITKVFMSVVALQLVEEGRLDLSRSVGAYLDAGVTAGIPNASTATIASLLTHTSGIPSWEDDPMWIREGRGQDVDVVRVWGATDALKYIRYEATQNQSIPDLPIPGKFSYSNANFTFLGLIIEAIVDGPVGEEVRSRILQPLGLKSIYLEGFDKASSNHVPHRYHFKTSKFSEVAGVSPQFPEISSDLIDASASNLSVEWAAGGMLSTATDLATFLLAVRDGTLLKPSSMELMTTWIPAGGEGEVSHGLFRIHRKHGAVIGHDGGVLGFTAFSWWAENDDCIVTCLSNVGVMHCGKDLPAPLIGRDENFVDLAKALTRTLENTKNATV